MSRLSNEDLIRMYGAPGSAKAQKRIHLVHVPKSDLHVPDRISVWVNDGIGMRFVDVYNQVCRLTGEWPTEIQSYNVRHIRDSEHWSLHSWALAWDVFLDDSGRRDPKTGREIPSVSWFEAWRKRGFVIGADFRHPDPHHIEYPYPPLTPVK